MGSSTASGLAICNCLSLRQAARQVTQLYDEALAPTGLRITQYSVLAAIGRRAATLQTLAEELVMDRSTLGHNLRPLERLGLVALATDDADRRARRLELTARGRAKLEAARPLWRKAQARFERAYGAEASGGLRETLAQVVAATR